VDSPSTVFRYQCTPWQIQWLLRLISTLPSPLGRFVSLNNTRSPPRAAKFLKGDRVSTPDMEEFFFPLPPCPSQLWTSPSLRGPFPQRTGKIPPVITKLAGSKYFGMHISICLPGMVLRRSDFILTYRETYKNKTIRLAPWVTRSKDLEKLTVAQVVKKYPAVFTRARHWTLF
jgi:hypothetical protein